MIDLLVDGHVSPLQHGGISTAGLGCAGLTLLPISWLLQVLLSLMSTVRCSALWRSQRCGALRNRRQQHVLSCSHSTWHCSAAQ